MELTVDNVKKIFFDCMFSKEDIPENGQPPKDLWAIGGGIIRQVIFDKRKIAKHKDEIKSLLSQLPESFYDPMGECFIKMPFTKDEKQWGEQINAEQLMSLGRAANFVFYTPKVMWPLSYGVPMVTIDLEEKENYYQKMIDTEKKEKDFKKEDK